MGKGTLQVLGVYVVLLIVGQAAAVGVGLLLDPISKTAALSAFIPIYYGMYWVAWRLALLIADPAPQAQEARQETRNEAGSPAKLATWLLAPAVLAFDIAE